MSPWVNVLPVLHTAWASPWVSAPVPPSAWGAPFPPEMPQVQLIPPLGRLPDDLAFHPELSVSPDDRWASRLPLGSKPGSPAGATRSRCSGNTSRVGGSVSAATRPHPPAAHTVARLFLVASCCPATGPHRCFPCRWSSECWPRPAVGASVGTTASCT